MFSTDKAWELLGYHISSEGILNEDMPRYYWEQSSYEGRKQYAPSGSEYYPGGLTVHLDDFGSMLHLEPGWILYNGFTTDANGNRTHKWTVWPTGPMSLSNGNNSFSGRNYADDLIYGNGGDDSLGGLYGNDVLDGGEGNDVLSGGDGDDVLIGQSGNDNIQGGNENDQLLGGSGNDVLQGGTGDDLLVGGSGDDNLSGGDGNDILTGGAGNDTLAGGAGNDSFVFNLGDGQDTIQIDDTAGVDTLAFGAGIGLADLRLVKEGYDLTVYVGQAGDRVRMASWYSGGAEYHIDRFSFADGTTLTWQEFLGGKAVYDTSINDSFTGNDGVDEVLVSDVGNDSLFGYSGNDVLYGGVGDDNLSGGAGGDTLDGGIGNDILQGGDGNDVLSGGAGNDSLSGGNGNDVFLFSLGDGQDTIQIDDTAGVDTLAFGAGIGLADLRLVKEGYDLTVYVGQAGDRVRMASWYSGGAGYHIDRFSFADGTTLTWQEVLEQIPVHGTTAADVLDGNNGIADILAGDEGADTLAGYSGNDTLFGEAGNDTLQGGDGNDILIGGVGNDSLSGGNGDDMFVFNATLDPMTNRDSITDFVHGQDRVQLSRSVFAALTDEGTLSSDLFAANATGAATDGNDYFLYNTTSGALLYDADGNGQGVAVQFATLTTKPQNVTASDFLVAA